MNLVRASKKFLDHRAIDRYLSENTIKGYSTDLKDFLKWLLARKPVKTITTETMRAYFKCLARKRKLSVATVRRRFYHLRTFFGYLSKTAGIKNPFIGWEVKLPRHERLPRMMTREEAIALLAPTRREAAKRSKSGWTYLTEMRLMIATGIRVGELCAIQVRDMSSDGSTLRICGKGSRERVVYITNRRLRADLRRLVSIRKKERGNFGPLFVNQFGRRLRPDSVRYQLNGFAKNAGLNRRITPHMLRHTAATLLMEQGTDIRFVQRLLGHSTVATTEMYTHVSDEALRSTLKRANVLGALAR
jgi:integrase/recombinase XerD